MIAFNRPAHLDLKKPHIMVASWFGSGFMIPAPGTWGSLAALPPGLLIYWIGGPGLLALAIIALGTLGFLWAIPKFEQEHNEKDSSMIVIDEVVGQWIPLLIAGLNPFLILLSFGFFRFFDIFKIWPANIFDKKMNNAFSVMADDIFAGLYATLAVMFIQVLVGI